MIPTVHHLDLSDQRIAFYDEGDPTSGAPPLVLLHGGAVDKRLWHPQLAAFPDRRIIVPDARGHGGSSDAEGEHRLVDDVLALLDALHLEQVVVVGISMGGGTAGDLALEHPERVAGIVVSGTGTSEPEFSDPWALQAFGDWRAAEQGGDLQAWIDVFQRFTAGPTRTLDQVDPAVRDRIAMMARDTVVGHLRTAPDGTPVPPPAPTAVRDTWERLPGLEVPVLALCGALDGADHRANGRRLADVVPDGRYVEVPGAAHYPNLEEPELFDSAVRDLLDRAASRVS
ncbi:MAG: alpha/beta fold hydrolase [Brachybacterium tyrofermentans]